MSRITGSEVASLMEAYAAVYAPQELTEEQIWEEVENWVNSLLEEGYDLSEYTWEEMYENYIIEMGQTKTTGQNSNVFKPTPGAGSAGGSGSGGRRGSGIDRNATQTSSSPGALRVPAATTPSTPARPSAAPAAPTPQRPATAAPARPSAAPARPAAAKPAKPAGSAMDQWAKANPKLAAASAEKARIRGTQQTDNPLMKDMRSRLPMNSPSVQSPAVSKLGAGNQSLSQNPNAFKAATPSKAIAAAPSTSAAASGSVAPATAAIASSPKPTPVAPRQTAREKVLNQSYEYDAFDLVLEYLIDNEHVETVDEALYVMMKMDAETIGTIVEAAADQSDKQIDKGVKTTYKAGNVLDNTHQGRSPGLNKLPRGEREEKAQRMRGRLKARRDDLFGERNKREDAAREEMKKKYGL